jgi:hypothetical protein
MRLIYCILWEPPTGFKAAEDGGTVLLYELSDGEWAAGGCDGGRGIGSAMDGRLATREQERQHGEGGMREKPVYIYRWGPVMPEEGPGGP